MAKVKYDDLSLKDKKEYVNLIFLKKINDILEFFYFIVLISLVAFYIKSQGYPEYLYDIFAFLILGIMVYYSLRDSKRIKKLFKIGEEKE